jgi:hypothetical protein
LEASGKQRAGVRGRRLDRRAGRAQIAGLEPGAQIRLRGMVGIGDHGRPAMINPAYELLR